ncbi:MAG: hypothetical protein HC901_01560, partial [Bdellovibrionaceae bacterium]|nr:hypothetical protein [Pseudobdellovibrionaceae bacterium]
MHITIIGEGAWGSAVGRLLQRNGHSVDFLHRNDRTWPGRGPGQLVFLALPCQAVRGKLQELAAPEVPVVSLIKGLEAETGLRVTQVVQEVWPGTACACISGPSLATEVQWAAPTAAVVANLRDDSIAVDGSSVSITVAADDGGEAVAGAFTLNKVGTQDDGHVHTVRPPGSRSPVQRHAQVLRRRHAAV